MSAPPVGFKAVIKEVLETKAGLIGTSVLVGLVLVAVGVVAFYGYDVVTRWNDPFAWFENPRYAAPEWSELFSTKSLPRTIILDREDFVKSEFVAGEESLKYVNLEAYFYYSYDDFPSEISLILNGTFGELKPLVKVRWMRPDGRKLLLASEVLETKNDVLFISSDDNVRMNAIDFMWAADPSGSATRAATQVILFAQFAPGMGEAGTAKVLKSESASPIVPYTILIQATMHDQKDSIDAKLIVYGKVYGLAGTDDRRRDLTIGILWGAPVALAFGLVSSIAITMIQTFLGAFGAWYGGSSDEIVQRVTDVYLVIPFLPVLITVSFIYKLTVLSVLAVLIVLSLFGGLTKSVRSMVLQIKQEPYIEAAVSYGADRMRILLLYILPRIMPYAFASIVSAVPAYVFLEAALSLLGLGDPVMPTWGKIISEAYGGGALYHGLWWWVLIPSSLVLLTAASFALLAYSFDKILNPRLREA